MSETAAAITESIDSRMLPPQMRRIVRAIGVAQTFVLLRWRGGRHLKLPRNSARSEIASIIGAAALEALIAEFGAQEILTLPKVDKMILQIRDHAMRMDYASGAGKSIREIAGLYGLTDRHVLNILGAGRNGAPVREHEPKQRLLL